MGKFGEIFALSILLLYSFLSVSKSFIKVLNFEFDILILHSFIILSLYSICFSNSSI